MVSHDASFLAADLMIPGGADKGGIMDAAGRKKILVTIQEGYGKVCEDTVPDGIEVEILNLDLLTTDPQAEIPWWSKELRAYWRKNHKAWGRCEPGCPCQRLSSFTSRHDTT
jgi:hypothetical protein